MKNKLPIFVLASILAGAIAGFVGYAIGQYFYMLFVFPFVLLIGGVLLFIPILKFFKALNPIFNALCGLLMGLMIFTSFHYTEYSIFRSRLTARLEASQSINEGEASKSVDAFLKEKTGLSGFLGFMKYQQSQWRPYVFYFIKDGTITGSQDLALRGKIAWFYLAGEAGVLLGGLALTGFWAGRSIPLAKKTE